MCFFRGANQAMCCKNGNEALDLFLKSNRIKQDLIRAVLHSQWSLFVVCRQWLFNLYLLIKIKIINEINKIMNIQIINKCAYLLYVYYLYYKYLI